MTTGADTYKNSDGKSVNVNLLYSVTARQVAVVDQFLGITAEAGESGETVALLLDPVEYQFTVPSSLSVSKGDTVYITVANLTGHTPNDNAYSTSAGSGKVALFKATAAKDSNHVVTGILCVL